MCVNKQAGFVLVLWALVIPTMLLCASFVLLSGASYARHAELSHLALQSGKSGSLVLLEQLEIRAQENYRRICENLGPDESPPAICSSENVSDFLETRDLGEVIVNASPDVWRNAKDFGLEYDPHGRLDTGDIQILFPFDFQHDSTSCTVSLKVVITDSVPSFLDVFSFGKEQSVTVDSVVTIDLENL